MAKATRRTLEKATFDLLVTKYRANPKSFERQFPSDVSQIVRKAVAPYRVSRPPFRMTEREKRHRADSLNSTLDMAKIPPQDAIKGIEHCAVLIQDETLTHHVNRDRVITLFKAAYGKSPESYRKNTVIPIEGGTEEPVYHSSLLRGVVADLDLEMCLVSITITPSKIREGKRMMRLVGIGRGDSRDDVSINHDDYLAEIYYDELHGRGWRDSEKDGS